MICNTVLLSSRVLFVFKRHNKLFQIKSEFLRTMTTNTDHLERTAASWRNPLYTTATVVAIKEESKTVKRLKLKIHDPKFTFKAGQWIDMAIPQICTVGGFSMCSTPEQLQKEGTLDLAVKYSKHPPADWVHTKCKEGTVLMVRAGGDVFYDPGPSEPPHDLLLIAGGIGINPLHSIFSHVSDQSKGNNSVAEKVQLLYSAVTEDELIFKSDIEDMATKNSQLRCQFHVTKGESNIGCKAGRINEEDIKETFKWLNKDHTKTYICGPSPMIADIENILVKLGLNKKSIFYEKWW